MTTFPLANAHLVFHSSWSGPLVLAALGVAVVFSLLLNRPTRRALGPAALLLLALEALCAVLLVLWMVNPRLRYEKRATGQGDVAVAVDRSLSMATRDAPGGQSRFAAARDLVFSADHALLPQLAGLGRVKLFTFGAGLEDHAPGAFPQQPDPAGFGTDLKGLIDKLAARARSQNLQAIVLLSDGVHTESGDPAAAARQAGVPIYTIGLGKPGSGAWRNIGIAEVRVPTRVTVNQEVEVAVTVRQAGFTGATVPLEARLGDKVIASQGVRLAPQGTQTVKLKLTPDRKGTLNYTVGVPHQDGDALEADDAQRVTVMAADARLRVLYVEGSLRWIYKFVRRVIDREQSIQADCVILTGGGKMMQQGEGSLTLRGGLPADLAGMRKYDVIVLGDFPRGLLDDAGLSLLDEYVKDKKGGLMVIGGPLVLNSGEYAGSPLAALLPAQLTLAGAGIGLVEIPNPRLTGLGRGAPVLKGLEDYFPKLALRRIFDVAGPKPGAEVWLESGVKPLLLAERYGQGRTMLLTSDDLWAGALRETARVEASPTGKFWIQALLWLAQRDGQSREDDPLLLARTDKSFYDAGETVLLSAQLRKPKTEGAPWGTIKGEVRQDGQPLATLALPTPDAQGQAALEWRPPHEGAFTLVLAGAQEGGQSTVECAFTVGRPFRELERPGLDEDLLREIARASGGAYFTLQAVGGVAEAMQLGKAATAQIVEKDLLDSPLFFLLFFALASVDWIIRRRRNLV